jgi:hypothetical protein
VYELRPDQALSGQWQAAAAGLMTEVRFWRRTFGHHPRMLADFRVRIWPTLSGLPTMLDTIQKCCGLSAGIRSKLGGSFQYDKFRQAAEKHRELLSLRPPQSKTSESTQVPWTRPFGCGPCSRQLHYPRLLVLLR